MKQTTARIYIIINTNIQNIYCVETCIIYPKNNLSFINWTEWTVAKHVDSVLNVIKTYFNLFILVFKSIFSIPT